MARWDLTSNTFGIKVTYTNEATGEVWDCGTTDARQAWTFLVEQMWAGDSIFLDGKPCSLPKPVFMAAA
jgi:hypothetical protein